MLFFLNELRPLDLDCPRWLESPISSKKDKGLLIILSGFLHCKQNKLSKINPLQLQSHLCL